MDNKNIPTGLGAVILIIVAATTGLFFWKADSYMGAKYSEPSADVVWSGNQSGQPEKKNTECAGMENKKLISIGELGVKIPVDSEMAKDMVYRSAGQADPDDNSRTLRADFSFKTLNASYEQCEENGVVKLFRALGKPSDDVASGGSRDEDLAQVKQFDGFYVYVEKSGTSCSSGKDADIENRLTEDLTSGLECLSPISL